MIWKIEVSPQNLLKVEQIMKINSFMFYNNYSIMRSINEIINANDSKNIKKFFFDDSESTILSIEMTLTTL